MSADMIRRCDDYLAGRTGRYRWRRVRYRAAIEQMLPLRHDMTVVDVGAGWTELDYTLRTEEGWRGRYIPIDGGIDGVDLERWSPAREAEWFVALEIIEHLAQPERLLVEMQCMAKYGVVVSTPNPETTDVLGMDPTHLTPCGADLLERWGFKVERRAFYGQANDSLFGVWRLND